MLRIHVVGVSGVGKSTLAINLAGKLRCPHLELDSIHHQANWAPLETIKFRKVVDQFCIGDRWVICGNYSQVRDLIWARADTVVWLDLPRWAVMRQIVLRSLKRVIFRRQLWNGNRESWAGLFSLDPDKSVIMWAWTRHGTYRRLYSSELKSLKGRGVEVVQLCSDQEVTAWLKKTQAVF